MSSLATQILKSSGLYSDEVLERIASQRAANPGMGLAEAAVKFGGVKELEFLTAIGGVLGLKVVDLEKQNPSPEALQKLPASAVYQFNVLPFQADETSLTVVTPDPFDTKAADGLRLVANCRIRTALAPKELVEKAVKKFYGVGAEAIEKMLEDGRYDVGDEFGAMTKIDVNEMGEEASIVRFVNQIIAEADRQGATDIHIEPQETELRIRYRIDGMLHKVDVPPQLNRLKSAIISRIKVMANLDIAEKRLPQDGRISLTLGGRAVDVRVSTLPSSHGERVVMRILDKNTNTLNLQDLGMTESIRERLCSLIRMPHGIILVTGPTGSGKSTTLYASLANINSRDLNIMTVEDPVEYDLDGISQTQVNAKAGMTFAKGLRAILRQDPDVVMIGEIRDFETADIAVQASMTGHLVLSTLHTNTAIGAITRLHDMGVEPFLLSTSLIGVLAQRLVRTLCPECRVPCEPNESEREMLGLKPGESAVIYRPKPGGCPHCGGTGFKGRTGIHELVTVDENVRRAIHDNLSEQEIEKIVRPTMPDIMSDGMKKVLLGKTSIEEVLRVAREE